MKKTKPITVTAEWVRHDAYHYYEKVPRRVLLTWLLKGRMHLRWYVPATQEDKRLHLEGKPAIQIKEIKK